jgi:hypothetical protein
MICSNHFPERTMTGKLASFASPLRFVDFGEVSRRRYQPPAAASTTLPAHFWVSCSVSLFSVQNDGITSE